MMSYAGGDGDDRLDGGVGTDVVQGGAGNDTYVFGLGYGQEVIEDSEGAPGSRSVPAWMPTTCRYRSMPKPCLRRSRSAVWAIPSRSA